jgi:F0F1-type ATP synthase assembly protein I
MATATAPQQSIGATSRRPFSIKRFVILGLFWIFIGAFIGSIVAGSMDLLPFWAIPVTVIGFIAISFIWSGIFTKGVL